MAYLDDIDELIEQFHLAQGEVVKGNPQLVQKLLSRQEDVTLNKGVALATDHEGRSSYLPEPVRGIESIFRFNRSNHVGRVPVRSHPAQRSRKPHRCPGQTLSECRARDSRR